jgi:hypothetical protein
VSLIGTNGIGRTLLGNASLGPTLIWRPSSPPRWRLFLMNTGIRSHRKEDALGQKGTLVLAELGHRENKTGHLLGLRDALPSLNCCDCQLSE